jgi:hypothetical protein
MEAPPRLPRFEPSATPPDNPGTITSCGRELYANTLDGECHRRPEKELAPILGVLTGVGGVAANTARSVSPRRLSRVMLSAAFGASGA